MKTIRVQAKQVHPVPKQVTGENGPFPDSIFKEPEIIYDYEPELNEDGSDFPKGATAQNKFKPIKWLVCGSCFTKVKETETENHVCKGEHAG
jgi:hypothetical protein